MKQFITLVFIFVVFGLSAPAQEYNCYESNRNKGIQQMQKRTKEGYEKAIKYFNSAKKCPDKPTNNDLDAKIKECRRNIGDIKIKPETVPPVSKPDPPKPSHSKTYNECKSILDKAWAKVRTAKDCDDIEMAEYSLLAILALEGIDDISKDEYDELNESLENIYEALEQKKGVLDCEETTEDDVIENYLTVDGKNAVSTTFNADGGSEIHFVSTNASSWTTWGVPRWCTVEEQTINSFKLICNANPTSEKRTDWMTVKTDNMEVRIDISQSGKPKPPQIENNYLYVNNEIALSTSFSAEGGAKSFQVTSNTASWTAGDVPSWCTIENMTTNSFNLCCKANNSTNARSAYMRITNEDREVRIKISQFGKQTNTTTSTTTNNSSSGRWPSYYWNPYFGLRFAYTQRTFRVTGGGLSNPEQVDFFGEDGWMKGFQMGMFFDPSGYNPWGMFGLNFGLNLEMYFSTWENAPHNYQYEYYDEYMDINLYLPIDLTFHIPFGPESALYLYGGIGFDFNCYNELTISIDSYANPLTNQYGKDSFNRFNFSYEYGLNLKLRGVMFYGTYQRGLSHHPIFSGYSTTIDKFSLGMSIVFGY